MVNLKTKTDKHTNDDERRRRSIKEKEKAKLNQSQIVKQALSESCLRNSSSKKIKFNYDDDATEPGPAEDDGSTLNGNGKFTLFDNSDSEDEDIVIKEKTQFSGKKGFQLLNLQSTYGNDERFKIDERFLENEGDEVEESKSKGADDADTAGEKAAQLKILESVLGTSVVAPESEKKKKRTFEMIRYDASNKDHEVYEKNIQTETVNLTFPKKRRENKKTLRTAREEVPKPKVSKDKFYEVSNEIKSRFKEKQSDGAQFSLLQTYGENGLKKDQEVEEEKKQKLENFEESADLEYAEGSEFENAVQEEEAMVESESKIEEKSVTVKGIWKESFFFDEDDARFKEGLEFINKKESSEAVEAAENFDRTRKRLKEILRLHFKKQMQKTDPFKHKIGGMNKKQLANSKLRNSKTSFNNRKTPQRNYRRTT